LARLVIKFRDGTIKNVDLSGVLSLGRQSTNDVQIPEELSSRQHARIIPSGRSFIVEDLRSANGTFVNGQQIQRRALANGDLIRIGGCELAFKDDAAKDLVGELIAERYRVLGKLGSGGMGTVYKALQISMDREVALKVLNPELTRDREFVVGFLNEARTAGQLNHPNIIQVHDFGEWEGFYYFSMEMVDGENVLTVIKREGKIPPDRALTMMGMLFDALNHAHAHSIVHQDIKPQNLMVDRKHKDVIKLADLGLAKVMGPEKGPRRGLLMGTPHYMAPEQAKGGAVDGRTDIYAAGATLFHMLTGRVPYDGKNSIEILTKHVKNDIPDPRQYDVSIPESVATLTMHMMAKDPAHRPTSAKEIAERARDILQKESARFQKAAAPKQSAGAARVIPRRQLRRAVRQRRQSASLMPWVLICLFVIALTAVAIVFGMKGNGNGKGNGSNGSSGNGKGQDMSHEEAVRFFASAEVYRKQGNYVEAERLLNKISSRRPATADDKKASRIIVEIDTLRGARRDYDRLARFMEQHPQALRTAQRQLRNFLARYPSAPERKRAESKLARIAEALAGKAGNGGTTKGPSREEEATAALKTVIANANALERREEHFAAERALLDFAGMFTGTRAAAQAKKSAAEFRSLGNTYMGSLLQEARKHSEARRFRKATEIFSQIISANPGGQWGRKAREALAAQDAAAKSAYQKGWNSAIKAFREFRFAEASRQAGGAARELPGTSWQGKLERLASDAMSCAQLHAAMVKVISSSSDQLPSPFKVSSPYGMKQGRIVSATVTSVSVKVEQGEVAKRWRDLKPAQVATVYLMYKVPSNYHLAAGTFFTYHGLKKQAKAELRRARHVKATRDEAERRLAELEGRANLLSYDFSSGMQMLDWNAASGSWGIKKAALAGGGAGESVITLGKARYSARGLVFSFEFKMEDAKSVFTAELYSSGNDYLGITVDPRQGLALVSAVGGTPLTRMEKVKLAPGRAHVLRIGVTRDKLEITADGRKLPALEVPRIETLSGSLRFKMLDGKVTIDNVEARNSTE
jgi:pSer/pThr/pTyr-binding forkhead associated (FHA) protein/acyl-CoA hydrolase